MKQRRKEKAAKKDVFEDDDDMQINKTKTPEELDTMSVISDMRSKANNRSRHHAEFKQIKGVNANGAQVFKSVANLRKVRSKKIIKKKRVESKRVEKALSNLEKQEVRVEKDLGKTAIKQRLKNLWD